MRGRLTVLLAASALAGLLWFSWPGSWRVPAERETSARTVPAPAAAVRSARSDVVATARGSDAAPIDAERIGKVRVDAAPIDTVAIDRTTGGLHVSVSWQDRRWAPRGAVVEPPVGVVVEVRRARGDPLFDNHRARTDGSGVARFENLSPGEVEVSRHGDDGGHQKQVRIAAGTTAFAQLVIGRGVDVRGLVVDAQGAPVGGADLLVVASRRDVAAEVVGHSAADGRFLLRALRNHSRVGASAPGFSPSPMRACLAGIGGEAQLVIRLQAPGSGLRGVVSDPAGRPVPGAVVEAGSRRWRAIVLPDGTTATAPPALRRITDAEGRFHFAGLPPGRTPLSVRSPGLLPHAGEVELLAGQTGESDVRLLPGVTLVGTVRDTAGLPVRSAEVAVGQWLDFAYQSCSSDGDGAFRLEGLAAGELRIAVHSGQHRSTTATLSAVPGQALWWDAVLDSGVVLRGRLLDHAGAVVAHARIDARQEEPSVWESRWGRAVTGADGRFTLRCCDPGVPLVLAVRGTAAFPELRLERVQPGGGELLIRLPQPVSTPAPAPVPGSNGFERESPTRGK